MCTLHTDVVGLEVVLFGAFDGCVDRFRFTCNALVAHLQIEADKHTSENGAIEHSVTGYLDETDIGGQLVALLDDNDIARNQVKCGHACLITIADDETLVRKHGTN